MPPLREIFAVLTILGLGAAPVAAQWASIQRDPGHPVVLEAALALHDDGSALHGFSSLSKRWDALAPTGTSVVASAARGALLHGDLPGEGYRAWSALSNRIADLAGPRGALELVASEVALVIRDEGGTLMAHAWSAQTDAWSSLALASASLIAFDAAVGDSVAVVRDAAAYHGFSAYSGSWVTVATGTKGDVPAARGNVASASRFDTLTGLGPKTYVAFSALTASWAESPVYHFSNVPEIGHDFAYVRLPVLALQRYQSCAFSAFTGQWHVDEGALHGTGLATQHAGEQVLLIEDLIESVAGEAFCARTGEWGLLAGQLDLVGVTADAAVVQSLVDGTLFAFSGLASGGWRPRGAAPGAALLGGGLAAPVACKDGAGMLHAFSPAYAAWSEDVSAAGSPAASAGSDALAFVPSGIEAWSERWNHWTSGPPLLGGAPIGSPSGGGLLGWLDATGALAVFDERLDSWATPLLLGPGTDVVAGRSIAVARSSPASADVRAWSVQRGAWESPPAALAAPLALGPAVDDEVAVVEDAAGALWAYGGASDLDVRRDWPDGAQVNLPSVAGGVVHELELALAGAPGELAFVLLSTGVAAPLELPGLGSLCLDPGAVFLIASTAIGAPGIAAVELPMPPNVTPPLQAWFQGFFFEPVGEVGRLGTRCDAAWIF